MRIVLRLMRSCSARSQRAPSALLPTPAGGFSQNTRRDESRRGTHECVRYADHTAVGKRVCVMGTA